MKLAVSIFICWVMWPAADAVAQKKVNYTRQVQAYRDSVHTVFACAESSILLPADLKNFHGIEYFPVDERYRVKARFTPIKVAQARAMPTSGSRTPLFKPYGVLSFKLDGKKCRLTLYKSADPARPELSDYLLLAFTDLTSGVETYGGGRYLEFKTHQVRKQMVVDFNYCFNPYCAYNPKFSCVLPPPENDLPVRVEAGPRKFHD